MEPSQTPDQPEPVDQPRRGDGSITISLTRDTFWLVLAVLFLALAIGLSMVLGRPAGRVATVASATDPVSGQPTALSTQFVAIPVVPAAPTVAAGYPVVVPSPTVAPSPTSVAEPLPLATAPPTLPPLITRAPTAAPVPTFAPTRAVPVNPTAEPPPPTREAQPPAATLPPAGGGSDGGITIVTPEAAPPTPTAVPVTVIRGDVRWTADQGPYVLTRDHAIPPGARLVIDAGTEVRLGPGVAFHIEGTLLVLGRPDQPVRITRAEGPRWQGIYGREGSLIRLEHADIRGGGAGGTTLVVEGGELTISGVRITDTGGHVQVIDSQRFEMRDSEISGNDMPYGAALDVSTSRGGSVRMENNRIGGNRLAEGAPAVRIANDSSVETVSLTLERNLVIGGTGGNLVISTGGPIQGTLSCNTLNGGTPGLSIRTQTPQVPGVNLLVRNNSMDEHTPPIEPVYLTYGIGRAAASEVALDMRGNWWGEASGPYEPTFNPEGRGDAVGVNIAFDGWLQERPACAPR